MTDWQKWLNTRLEANSGLCFVVTGSNSQLLGGELASALTGRHLRHELLPFDLSEFRQRVSARSNRPLQAVAKMVMDSVGSELSLRRAISTRAGQDLGKGFENLVYLVLRFKTADVCYCKGKGAIYVTPDTFEDFTAMTF